MSIICGICGKGKQDDLFTFRQSWLAFGGFGSVPEYARVHLECDNKEQEQIKSGKIKLENLYIKK